MVNPLAQQKSANEHAGRQEFTHINGYSGPHWHLHIQCGSWTEQKLFCFKPIKYRNNREQEWPVHPLTPPACQPVHNVIFRESIEQMEVVLKRSNKCFLRIHPELNHESFLLLWILSPRSNDKLSKTIFPRYHLANF